LTSGRKLELIKKAGAFYSYNGERIGQGRENAKTYLDEHPELMDEIENRIKNGDAAEAAKEALALGRRRRVERAPQPFRGGPFCSTTKRPAPIFTLPCKVFCEKWYFH
jgi:hypothetical protein